MSNCGTAMMRHVLSITLILCASVSCTGGDQASQTVEAVVFYRVFSISPSEDTCRVNVAIPVRSHLEKVPEHEGKFDLVLRRGAKSVAELRDSPAAFETQHAWVLKGDVVAVQDGEALFEPRFSPVTVHGGLCSKLEMERGRVKYVRLGIAPGRRPGDVSVISVQLERIEPGQVLFMK